ncbi:hypothetical protein Y032_0045g1279 [Ancylostoma ceylanicum]|uniref:Uncharacterized protein n=1 Tax=Ancylostoma ceylanicum TaxID=53326 RepID=A0A016UDA5_9BILA|nr:hypothetical protein Y032_0045g1279 [Ancylostoma ceylanicum]
MISSGSIMLKKGIIQDKRCLTRGKLSPQDRMLNILVITRCKSYNQKQLHERTTSSDPEIVSFCKLCVRL